MAKWLKRHEITQGTMPPQKSEDKKIAGHKDFQRRDSFISFNQKKRRQQKRKAQREIAQIQGRSEMPRS